MTELFVVLIGVVAFGGSLFWRRRHLKANPPASDVEEPAAAAVDGEGTSCDAGPGAEVGGDPVFEESSFALRTPRVRVPSPAEPPDPLVVAVCSVIPDGVISVRLRCANDTKVLY